MLKRIILFLILNFAALGIGGFFTGTGVSSSWYMDLNKAPWTPPGWVFGAAWTFIMICFSFYMAFLFKSRHNKSLIIGLYLVQWLLNVSWNPVFFKFQNILFGMLLISALTLLVAFLFVKFWQSTGVKNILLLPYLLWLLIASSLNAYILLNN